MTLRELHTDPQLQRIINNWKLTPATLGQRLSKGQWIAAPWLKYVSTRVASGIARGNARIIVSAPPRHGKSELISVHTPTWVLENFPNRNVILAAYGADLAIQYGRRVRDQIRDNEHLLNCRVRSDVGKAEAFSTETNGYMYSVGLGGAITGRGAHVLLIDDYIKEIKEALSPAHRQYLWDWFVTTANTRLEPGGSIIIIATRWHSDDLIGRLLRFQPDKWENICLPAIALEGDMIGRHVGEPLFEARFDINALETNRDLLGSIYFHALYQQGPVDEVLKFTNRAWFKEATEVDHADFRWMRMWDCAATEGGGDYTTGTLVGYSKELNKTIIGNVIRKQVTMAGIEILMRNTAASDGIETVVGVEQEPGSAGKNLIVHIDTTVLPEYKVVSIPSTKSKIVRAQPMLAAAEAGSVYLLNESLSSEEHWHESFLKEIDAFGQGGENDDQVDTASAAYTYLSGKKVFSAVWGRTKAQNTATKADRKVRRQASFMMSGTGKAIGASFGRKARR